MNGLISKTTLDELETMFLYFHENYRTMPTPARVTAKDMLENAGKLIQCLHPDGPAEHHIIIVEPNGYNPKDHGEWPEGTHTLCVTGNGPRSQQHADYIAFALWVMPDLIRTCRALFEDLAERGEGVGVSLER